MSTRSKIIEIMRRKGWNTTELARTAGFSRSKLHRYLTGTADINTETADRLLEALSKRRPLPGESTKGIMIRGSEQLLADINNSLAVMLPDLVTDGDKEDPERFDEFTG